MYIAPWRTVLGGNTLREWCWPQPGTLWFTARAQLGAAFSLKPEARKLVTSGFYSKFRHPIYLFSTIGLAGLCIAMRWYIFGLLYVAIVAIMQWRRAKAERAVLEAAFGDQYREYRKQTWL